MISIGLAKQEVRPRDKKRKRLLLQIGKKKFHLTRAEAKKLRNQLMRFAL